MPRNKTTGNLALAGYDDIFSTAKVHDGECIVEMPLEELYPPDFHPFQLGDDLAMYRLAENIKQNGVLEPGLVRPRAGGGYELLCGNRRKRGCELAGKLTLPVIVRELDDSRAALVMVDSNLEQREKILPSEKAWAYKVMIDALYHSGVKGESHSYEIMAERTGVKKSQLFRTMRLTELITALADRVDSNQLAFNPAVELSYLSVSEQTTVAEAMSAYFEDLENRVYAMNAKLSNTSTSIKAVERKIKTLNEHLYQSGHYKEHRPLKRQYDRLRADYEEAKKATGLFAERKVKKPSKMSTLFTKRTAQGWRCSTPQKNTCVTYCKGIIEVLTKTIFLKNTPRKLA